MADVTSLSERIDAEFEAARRRSTSLLNEDDSYSEGRWKRLEQVDATLTEIRGLWRDRLSQLGKWFGDRIQASGADRGRKPVGNLLP